MKKYSPAACWQLCAAVIAGDILSFGTPDGVYRNEGLALLFRSFVLLFVPHIIVPGIDRYHFAMMPVVLLPADLNRNPFDKAVQLWYHKSRATTCLKGGCFMKKIISLLVFCLVLSSGALFAQEGGCPGCDEMQGTGGMSGGGMGMGMTGVGGGQMGISRILMNQDELKLSSDQVAKLEKMRADASRDTIKRRADIRIALMDVTDNLRGPNPNFAAAKSAMKKVSDLNLAAANAAIDAYANAFNVLTAEQKTTLSKLGPGGGMMRGRGTGR